METHLAPIDARLAPYEASDEELATLAREVHGLSAGIGDTLASLLQHEAAEIAPEEFGELPVAHLYFGQFLSHDLAFEPTAGFELGQPSPRTFALDLDSLYGAGPTAHPHLYGRSRTGRLALNASGAGLLQQHDLQRNRDGLACIEEPRNDENVLVSQVHVALARAHNALFEAFERLPGGARAPSTCYSRARTLLAWLYQWVVVHDWLPRILHRDNAAKLQQGALNYPTSIFRGGAARLTPEYAFAACRFGHAMVRPVYRLNGLLAPLPILPWGRQPGHAHLTLFRPLPDDWFLDWRLFVPLQPQQLARVELLRGPLSKALFGSQRNPLQLARRIRPRVTRRLALLPSVAGLGDPTALLAFRTLRAGAQRRLPDGATLAAALGVTSPISASRPLWWSILDEAERDSGGRRLGPLGSRLVGDTLIGALQLDPRSCLQRADFAPRALGSGPFDLAELLLLADQPRDELERWVRGFVPLFEP